MSEIHTPVLMDVDDLVPYDKNAKLHPDEQVDKIIHSIQEYGWNDPIIVDKDNVIIAGHGRRLAAKKMGLKRVPTIKREDLTSEQVRALRIDHNKASESGYDTSMLAIDLKELMDESQYDPSVMFNAREIEVMLSDIGMIDLDSISKDLGKEVEAQAGQTKDKMDKADKEPTYPIEKLFGAKSVTGDQKRAIAKFLAFVEFETQKTGIEALAFYAEKIVK